MYSPRLFRKTAATCPFPKPSRRLLARRRSGKPRKSWPWTSTVLTARDWQMFRACSCVSSPPLVLKIMDGVSCSVKLQLLAHKSKRCHSGADSASAACKVMPYQLLDTVAARYGENPRWLCVRGMNLVKCCRVVLLPCLERDSAARRCEDREVTNNALEMACALRAIRRGKEGEGNHRGKGHKKSDRWRDAFTLWQRPRASTKSTLTVSHEGISMTGELT